jgi:hypothetical protein
MTPLPWSHTSLDDFNNCPRAFHAKRVEKSIREPESEQMRWGKIVHHAFERRQGDGRPLPDELAAHEPFMQRLDGIFGDKSCEERIALNRKLEPCGFFDKDVWFRGVIDLRVVDAPTAQVVDYKTGKPHSKFAQHKLFALWMFQRYPDVQIIKCLYYWTTTLTCTAETYTRAMVPVLWSAFTPSLKQYVEAFRTDTWTPRPSGLCGWCPLTDCEHWRPRKVPR